MQIIASPSSDGAEIFGLEKAAMIPGVIIFHAATAIQDGKTIVKGSGRILSVTSTGETYTQARRRAYRAVKAIRFRGMQYRRDIAKKPANIEAKCRLCTIPITQCIEKCPKQSCFLKAAQFLKR